MTPTLVLTFARHHNDISIPKKCLSEFSDMFFLYLFALSESFLAFFAMAQWAIPSPLGHSGRFEPLGIFWTLWIIIGPSDEIEAFGLLKI